MAVIPFRNFKGAEEVSAETITITPEHALEILEKYKAANRPLSQVHVNRLAETMKKGEWLLNGEPIIFDKEGNLIDGQHRMWACAMSGVAITTLVVYGVDNAVFKTLDMGRKRSTSDIAALLNYRDHKVVGAAVYYLWKYLNQALHRFLPRPNNLVLYDLLEEHRHIEYSVPFGKKVKHLVPPSMGAFCHYVFSRLDQQDADRFFEVFETGEHLTKTSPIYWLRERLIRMRSSKAKLPDYEVIALAFKAWNYFRQGKEIAHLRWSRGQNEAFPSPV
ncbi:MAG: hypothetical protein FJ135_14985 [Deltaproteobacteria bacterium]|nr:hypothetical protein [Deltaproteobacteria bacterium]